jgi:hypothetical protein
LEKEFALGLCLKLDACITAAARRMIWTYYCRRRRGRLAVDTTTAYHMAF